MSTKYELCLNIELDIDNRALEYAKDANSKTVLDITSIDSKIFIFQQEVRQWLFESIRTLIDKDIKFITNSPLPVSFKHGIFILFGIFSYIEKMQKYRGDQCPNGNNFCSGYLVKNGIKRIFADEPTIMSLGDSELQDIVKKTRNSLMHEAMIGDDVLLNYSSDEFIAPISIHKSDNEIEIRIAPILIFQKICQDFDNYIEILSNGEDENLRNKFIEKFNAIYQKEIEILTSE